MKKVCLILLSVLFSVFMFAQDLDCTGQRYRDSIFGVTVTSNVIYGQNVNYNGSSRTLMMDIYTPTGDTCTKRPLIMFAPKGSFMQENKAELTMVQLCRHFASLGYVAASIDYRVGVNYMAAYQNAQKEFTLAVLRAAHDYKAAIRFFRKDFSTNNIYKIDTGIIIAGGSSAGAITAVQLAYLDKESEIPTGFDTTGLGGPEGYSGNPGYSSRPHFVVSLCGAIADSAWIEQGDMPIVSMHGNLDTEVPYGSSMVSMFTFPIMVIDGDASIKKRADNIGVENPFYTFWERQHIPYDENAGGAYLQYMDTVKNFITPVLHNWICGITSIRNTENTIQKMSVYPNPAKEFIDIELKNVDMNTVFKCEIFNSQGSIVYNQILVNSIVSFRHRINVSALVKGLYYIKLSNGNISETEKINIQ